MPGQEEYRAQAQQLEQEADAARRRIAANVDALHARLHPRKLMHDAFDAATARSKKLLVQAGNMARRGGAGLAGGAAVVGIAKAVTDVLAERKDTRNPDMTAHDEYAWAVDDDGASATGRIQRASSAFANQAATVRARATTEIRAAPLTSVLAATAAGALLATLLRGRERPHADDVPHGGLSDYDELPSPEGRAKEALPAQAEKPASGGAGSPLASLGWEVAKLALVIAQPRLINFALDLLSAPPAAQKGQSADGPSVAMMPEVGVERPISMQHQEVGSAARATGSEAAYKAGQL